MNKLLRAWAAGKYANSSGEGEGKKGERRPESRRDVGTNRPPEAPGLWKVDERADGGAGDPRSVSPRSTQTTRGLRSGKSATVCLQSLSEDGGGGGGVGLNQSGSIWQKEN